MIKILTESTRKLTWVNSGATPTSLIGAVYDGSDTVVNSGSMVSSGNGHYYYLFSVTTPGFYVAETRAVIDSYPYRTRDIFQAVTKESD